MTVRTQKFDPVSAAISRSSRLAPGRSVRYRSSTRSASAPATAAMRRRSKCLGDAPLPHLVVIGQEKAAFLARAADQQRDVVGDLRGRRVEGLRRQVGPVDDRAEIVAVEQRQRRTADRARGRRDRRREPVGRNLVQPLAFAARDAEFLQHGFGQRVGALAGARPGSRRRSG